MPLMTPHDAPHPERPHRLYFAITNACNRSCPWCSVYSRPGLQTFLRPDAMAAHFPERGDFEVQLEGGEPTIHPDFWDFVSVARAHERCTRLILSTNGTRIPPTQPERVKWLRRLGRPLTIKVSINHHLLEADRKHVGRIRGLADAVAELGEEATVELVINLRRRRAEDDQWVRDLVDGASLSEQTNDFYLQRYGLASSNDGLELPYLAGTAFTLVNPDGTAWGTDLIGRSEAMGALP